LAIDIGTSSFIGRTGDHSCAPDGKNYIFPRPWNHLAFLSFLSRIGVADRSAMNRSLLGSHCMEVDAVRTSMSDPRDEDPVAVPEVFEDEAVLDPRVQDAIGRSLKAHYDDLINAPIPDRFLVLLAQLEASERKARPDGDADER
jgi:Anti-sigma factor NepR